MGEIIDMVGKRIGRLRVIRLSSKRAKNRHAQWHCICDCGTEKIISAGDLRSGNIQSCGCYHLEVIKKIHLTHGKSQTRIYKQWQDAKKRVTDPNGQYWHIYGGRGISMSERWMDSFEAFFDDMGECPPGMMLERIDNDGNYEPGNCKWATMKEQANNTRRNVHVSYLGEKLTMQQYCELKGLNYGLFRYRYHEKKHSRAAATVLTQMAMENRKKEWP